MKQKLADGTLLGPYKIIRLLSKGGMGEVYEAYEELLNRKVALKIIAAEATEGLDVVNLFISEGQALAKINHPNVVTIYRLGLDNGHYYIAMEFVEGLSLNDFVKKKNPELREKLEVFLNILIGTQVLHSKSIIHRDLKPKNIIIESNRNAKIVDFGISEVVKENEVLTKRYGNKILGSVFYMSPEAARGEPISFQSDIWSLGVILYELVTGEKPFFDTTAAGVLKKVRTEKLTFSLVDRIKLHDNLKKIIQKMCEPTLHLRYKSVLEVKNDLAKLIEEQFLEKTDSPRVPNPKFAEITRSGITQSYNADLTEVIHQTMIRNGSQTATHSKLPDTRTSGRRDKSYRFKIAVLTILVTLIGVGVFALKNESLVTKTIARWKEQAQQQKDRKPASQGSKAKNENEVKHEAPLPEPTKKVVVTPEPVPESLPEPDPAPISQPTPPAAEPVSPPAKTPVNRLDRVSLKTSKETFILSWRKNYESRGLASDYENLVAEPTLSWRPVRNANQYELQISTDRKFKDIVLDTRVYESRYSWSEPLPGDFYWRVRAVRGSLSGDYSAPSYMQIELPAPSFKQSNYKVDKSTSVTLSWNTVPMASGYSLVISTQKNLSSPVVNSYVAKSEFTANLTQAGKYYASLTALDKNRKPASAKSITTQIEIIKRLNLVAPRLLIPENGTTVPTQGTIITPIIFNWSKSEGALSYSVQISTDKDFGSLLFETIANEEKYLFTQPLPRRRIYWRVQSINGVDKSKWTSPNYLDIE